MYIPSGPLYVHMYVILHACISYVCAILHSIDPRPGELGAVCCGEAMVCSRSVSNPPSSFLLLIVCVKVSAQLATVVVTRVPSSTSGMHACITWYLKNCNFMLQWWIPEVHSFAYVLPDPPLQWWIPEVHSFA